MIRERIMLHHRILVLAISLLSVSCLAKKSVSTPPVIPTPVGGFYEREIPVNTYHQSVHTLAEFNKKDMPSLQVFADYLAQNYKNTSLLKYDSELGVTPASSSIKDFGISSTKCYQGINCYFIVHADTVWFATANAKNQLIDYTILYGITKKKGSWETIGELQTTIDRSKGDSSNVVFFCQDYVEKKYEGDKYVGDEGARYIGKIRNDGVIETSLDKAPTRTCAYKGW